MNKRKFFGTIIGLIFWSVCIVFFTYAYYNWKSNPTNVVLGIEDLSVECLVGANVSADNIGPVLDYRDGVKAEFSINNMMSEAMAIELRLDITTISDNLLTKSLKYVLVADSTGGTNYDYNNPIIEGDFSDFYVGNILIPTAVEVQASTTQNYQFIIYIDGNMYNNPNIQENELNANLMIGNCGEDAIPMNEMIYQAIYSEVDKTLTFVYTNPLMVGDTYNKKQVTAVYTGFENAIYNNNTQVPWHPIRENIEKVNFDYVIKPKSTAYWFYGFNNFVDVDLTNLNTSDVTNMLAMFYGCSSLVELNLINFNTSKVTNMTYMFFNCSNLTSLDVSGFDTSNVVKMTYMFRNCSSLTELDVSNFDTSKVTSMSEMFWGCRSLIELDVSGWNTSKVEEMQGLFYNCNNLTNLDLSGWDTSNVTTMLMMFQNCHRLTATITIRNNAMSNYDGMFLHSATIKDSNGNYIGKIIINYIPDDPTTAINENTESLVDAMIATKSENSNVVKGSCIGANCPATT